MLAMSKKRLICGREMVDPGARWAIGFTGCEKAKAKGRSRCRGVDRRERISGIGVANKIRRGTGCRLEQARGNRIQGRVRKKRLAGTLSKTSQNLSKRTNPDRARLPSPRSQKCP